MNKYVRKNPPSGVVDGQKYCSKCKLLLDASCFGREPKRKSGLASWCKECAAKNTRKYYKPHPRLKTCNKCKAPKDPSEFLGKTNLCNECREKSKIKKAEIEKRKENREIGKQEREIAKLERDRIKQENISKMWWLKLSPEELEAHRKLKKREHRKKYKEKHKDKEQQRKRLYREKHKDKVRSRKKEYLKSHPEARKNRSKSSKHKREAKQKLLPFSFTTTEWNKCKQHFDNKCCYCGNEGELHQDHFIPLAKNGEYTANNIVPACPTCNVSKSDKDFFEWYPQQVFYSKRREQKILKYLHYKDGFQQIAI